MKFTTFFLWIVVGLCNSPVCADVRLPSVFTENMVLQRGCDVPIWGWADPAEKVTVCIGPHRVSAWTDAKGRWAAKLPPLQVRQVGDPYELLVQGKNTITLKNVLVGEVWLCSGQSNMEMPLGTIGTAWGKGIHNSELEVAEAQYPQIRLFTVWKTAPVEPQSECLGAWSECNPQTAYSFSAPAYFFGRRLHKELNIPIGLIHNSYSGLAIEAYMRSSVLESVTGYSPSTPGYEDRVRQWPEQQRTYKRDLQRWQERLTADAAQGGDLGWAERHYRDADWSTLKLPQMQDTPKLAELQEVVWFRKDVDVPVYWGGRDLELHLYPITALENICFNGTPIALARSENLFRVYRVPAAVVRPGRNVVAFRISKTISSKQFAGKAEHLKLQLAFGPDDEPISLVGEWRYQVGLALGAIPSRPEPAPHFYPPPDSTAWNGMVAPLIPFAIKGVIWYQGESNIDRAHQYRQLFPMMIRDWREQWGQGDFPFYYAQITNWPHPVKGASVELREAQLLALSLPNTGMAVTMDVCESGGHARNKLDIGERLARWALARNYGQKISCSGPVYRSMRIEGDKIRLSFDHVGAGLRTQGESLTRFIIAGEDRVFVAAEAVIEGETILVFNDEISKPVAVRYAWKNDVPNPSLFNNDGLPASSFRTDDWPGATVGKTTAGWWR